MTENDRELEALNAAADRLDANRRFYHWWPQHLPPWRDQGPIGKEEFLGVVADVVYAYVDALSKKER